MNGELRFTPSAEAALRQLEGDADRAVTSGAGAPVTHDGVQWTRQAHGLLCLEQRLRAAGWPTVADKLNASARRA